MTAPERACERHAHHRDVRRLRGLPAVPSRRWKAVLANRLAPRAAVPTGRH